MKIKEINIDKILLDVFISSLLLVFTGIEKIKLHHINENCNN